MMKFQFSKIAIIGALGMAATAIGGAISSFVERRQLEDYIDSRINERLEELCSDDDEDEE